ncbi:MAG: TetR/AcrR family transcriptional regulator [Pseudomonadota bacterium]
MENSADHALSEQAASPPHTKATRLDWLLAAQEMLIAEGVESVKILTLAKQLGVARASFYWHFLNRTELLNALLERWRDTNTKAITAQASLPSSSIFEGVIHIFECWVDRTLYDPRLDFAIREWARRSAEVRREVDLADNARVEAVRQLYLRHEYEAQDAFIRARVLYFMQIGYNALELGESIETRMGYIGDYLRCFTGREPSAQETEEFVAILKARSAQ